MARSRTSRRAPAAPARARSALRSSPAAASSTARSRATTRQRTPKKMKAAALRGALSDRARHGRVHVRRRGLVAGDAPSTRGRGRGARRGSATRKHLLVVLERGDERRLEEPAQRRRRARARRRPAEHLRRAVSRRRRVHPRRARGLPGRRAPAAAQAADGETRHEHDRGGQPRDAIGKDPRDVLRRPGGLGEELRAARPGQVHLRGRPAGEQDRDQDRRREGLRRQGRRR